jgi:putative PIN family toxin of toxin-antitoxin system
MALNRKPRVFLDTNVFFSGLHTPDGAPGIILEAFIENKICFVISRQVLEELVRTIEVKLPQAFPALQILLTNVPPEIQKDPPAEQMEKLTGKLNFADAAILTATINAKVDYFVTGDSHFREKPDVTGESGINILTPAQFVRRAGLKK